MPLPIFHSYDGNKQKRYAENDDKAALKVRSINNLQIVARMPHDHCACYCLRKSIQWHRIVEMVLGWREHDYSIRQANLPKTSRLNFWQNTQSRLSFTSFSYLFSTVASKIYSVLKTKHHARMCNSINTLRHKGVRTTMRLAYHGSKNLAKTSETRQIKCTQMMQLPTLRFACLLLFLTAKNRTQQHRRAKGCEV